jgi:hypothetical protein
MSISIVKLKPSDILPSISETVSPSIEASCPQASLEKILSLDNTDIYKKGVPQDWIKAWRDRFYHDLEKTSKHVLALSCDNSWAYDERFFYERDMKTLIETDKPNEIPINKLEQPREVFLRTFSVFKFPEFWMDNEAHLHSLVHLYRIHKMVAFAHDDLTERIFLKFMDCLVEKIVANTPSLQEKDVVSFKLPQSENHPIVNLKRLCCFKTLKGWIVGDFNNFPNVPVKIAHFDINYTRILALDPQDQILPHSSIIVEASRLPKVNKNFKLLIEFKAILYNGPTPLTSCQKNAIRFGFYVHLKDPLLQMTRFHQFSPWVANANERLPENKLKQIEEETSLLFNTFKDTLLDPFKKGSTDPLVFELLPPCNRTDELWVLCCFLDEIKKDPKANAKEIALLATEIGCMFSEEQIFQLEKSGQAEATGEGYAISTGPVVEKLYQTVKTELTQCILTPITVNPISPQVFSAASEKEPLIDTTEKQSTPSSTFNSTDLQANASTATPLSDLRSKTGVEDKQTIIELRKLEKEHKKAEYKLRKKKEERQAARGIVSSSQDTSVTSILFLNRKEKQNLESIYKGQPMKAKKFAQFARQILKKKAETQDFLMRENRVGSHPRLHFKRKDGTSGGVTFHFQHGRDDHGNLSAQKTTLERILCYTELQ